MLNPLRRTLVVTNPHGIHARPADLFAKLARTFQSTVEIVHDGERVDGKSIISLLTLGAVEGTQLTVEAMGDDAAAALDALEELVRGNFGETETTQL